MPSSPVVPLHVAPFHVAIDARFLNSSTGTVAVRLLDELQRIDAVNRYTVVVDAADRDYWRPTAPNFAVLPVSAPAYSFAEQLVLRRALARLRPDIVHFLMPQQPLFFFRGRKVTSFYDLTLLRVRNPHRSALAGWAKRLAGRFAFRVAARESARLVCCSAHTRDEVVRVLGADPDRTRLVYLAGDAPPGEAGTAEPPDTGFGRYLLYVGSHLRYKNVERLCDAHQRLLADHPDLGLVLVGRPDRESERTRAYAAARGYRNILFAGYLPDAERDRLYAHAAAYVFPSLMEGFGLPGLEAMARGVPVASSNATCLPEVYGDAALYFDPSDAGDMAAAVGRVLADSALRADLVARGRARAARYSWRRTAEQVLGIYRELGADLSRRG